MRPRGAAQRCPEGYDRYLDQEAKDMARYLASIVLGTVLFCTVAAARPPAVEPSADSAAQQAIVGRIRLREGVVDLSLSSMAEGGAAHRVARGLAGVLADVDTSRPAEHDSATSEASGYMLRR